MWIFLQQYKENIRGTLAEGHKDFIHSEIHLKHLRSLSSLQAVKFPELNPKVLSDFMQAENYD